MKKIGFILWLSIGAILYHLFAYPALLLVTSVFFRKRKKQTYRFEDLPEAALLIAARNEEACIADKLENSLALRYPAGKLRIIVVPNGCTDNTADVARTFKDFGVEVFEYGDIGKEEALNRTIAAIDSEILIFTDANGFFNKDAAVKLVEPYADKTVGVVAGRQFYQDRDSAAGSLEGSYWDLVENRLRHAEAEAGGAVGAAGSIYSVRKRLYEPMPPACSADLFLPLLISARGYRTVYSGEATNSEDSTGSLSGEYQRKLRIIRQAAYGMFRVYPWLLNPLKTGRLALLIWSHKVLRWFLPYFMLTALGAAILRLLDRETRFIDFAVVFGASLFLFFAMLGRGLSAVKPIPVLGHAYYTYLVLKAALVATWSVLSSKEKPSAAWGHFR